MLWLVILLALIVVAQYALAGRRARALDRAESERLLMQQERERVVDFMHHMVEALGEGLSREQLLQRIVHASILCSGALSACVFEKTDKGTMRGVAVEGLFPPHRPLDEATRSKLGTRAKFIEQVLKSEEFPVGDGIVGRVAQSGVGELLPDAESDPRIVKHDDPALKVKSVIAVPLAFRSRSFGVLAVTNPADDHPFTPQDFTLIQNLAEQAALALHNAELLNLQMEKQQLDMDLSLASGIQQMLLPRSTPEIGGLDVDARYAPAQRVGGDFYDLIQLSNHRLAVAVADVSGKGIPASLLMATCRTNLRQIAPRHSSPAKVLTELNAALAVDIERGLYITMSYAVFDVEANTVTFARAGHELPLFARRDSVSGIYLTEFVGSEGMPLGMVPNEIFDGAIEDRTEPFAGGDICVLFTDGLTETPNEDEKEFSNARLADSVRTLHARPARDLNAGIFEAVTRFAGSTPQRDDFTLVTVKRV